MCVWDWRRFGSVSGKAGNSQARRLSRRSRLFDVTMLLFQTLTIIHALRGICILALLMFVLGNRISQS